MLTNVSRYTKAVAAAVASFATTLGLVLQDDAISLDELGVLKAAVVAVLVAVGVYVSPPNRP
jgi:hypothetical protein